MDSVEDNYTTLERELLQFLGEPAGFSCLTEHGVLNTDAIEQIEQLRKRSLESYIPQFLFKQIRLSLREAYRKERLLSALRVLKPSLAAALFPDLEKTWKDILMLAPQFVGKLKHELLFPRLLQKNIIADEEFALYNKYMKGSSASAAKFMSSIIQKRAKANAPFSGIFIEIVLSFHPMLRDLFGERDRCL